MRRYVREGKISKTKVGKRYLIPESAIFGLSAKGPADGPREVSAKESARIERSEKRKG